MFFQIARETVPLLINNIHEKMMQSQWKTDFTKGFRAVSTSDFGAKHGQSRYQPGRLSASSGRKRSSICIEASHELQR